MIVYGPKLRARLDAIEAEAPRPYAQPRSLAREIDARIQSLTPYPDGHFHGRGIVTCAGGPRYQQCAYVLFKLLRHVGCTLPVECWYLDGSERSDEWERKVEPLGVVCRDASAFGFRTVADGVTYDHDHRGGRVPYPGNSINGYALKSFAILHSRFSEVLWLDADNTPVRDPAFLFDAPQYRHGAIFWPDNPERRLLPSSWQGFGLRPRAEREVEAGQLLIDKARCWEPLTLAEWLNQQREQVYRYIWGDKDTFPMAWRCLGRPFAMPSADMQFAGGRCPKRVGSLAVIVQHDFAGQPLFYHRVMQSKYGLDAANKPAAGYPHHTAAIAALDELRGAPQRRGLLGRLLGIVAIRSRCARRP